MTLRVLLVSSSSGSHGGGEFYLAHLAQGLTELGCDVSAVLADHPRMDGLAERMGVCVDVHRLPYRAMYDRRLRCIASVWDGPQIRRWQRLLADWDADILHVNKQNLEDGLDLLLAASRSGLPAVTTIHVTRTMSSLRAVAGGLRDYVAGRTLRLAGLPTITVAEACVVDVQRLVGPSIDVTAIHNGIPPAKPGDRDALREAWEVTSTDVVLGCVARIEPQKNPLFLPGVLARLPQNCRVVWIGDGRMRPALESEVDRAKVADRFLLTGWQSNATEQLSGCDIFVLPSLYEGFPFAILEAMSLGLPVVASDVDGVREAVIDGETGLLCPVNDHEAWESALRRLAGDPDLRRKLGDAGRARFERDFTVASMARKTLGVYYRVIANHRQTAAVPGIAEATR